MLSFSGPLAASGFTYYLAQELISTRLRSSLSERDALLVTSKLVGGSHALLAGSLALKEILDPKWTRDNLISGTSSWGDGVVALEAGYLIGDALFLIVNRKRIGDRRLIKRVLLHHVIVASLLLTYLRRAYQGQAKGIFFVSSFMMMNLSTPLRYVMWGLKKFGYASHRKTLAITRSLAMAVYAGARFGLIYYQLWVYGRQNKTNPIQAFRSLPLVCRSGISILLSASAFRFAQIFDIFGSARI